MTQFLMIEEPLTNKNLLMSWCVDLNVENLIVSLSRFLVLNSLSINVVLQLAL
jgi:hypothetical protein